MMVGGILKSIPRFSHKMLQGNALLVAGSKGMMGCVLLAGRAAMRTGLGLLSIKTISESEILIHSCIPEALIYKGDNQQEFSAVGIGPGLGKENEAKILLEKQLRKENKAIVIDADAINIIAENLEMLELVPKNSILTPHIGEFNRLIGRYSNSHERILAQREFAQKHMIYVVLKGPYTSVATPSGKVFFNTTGNQGMSTAGSGDVLTGIILSLLSQGYTSEESALLGVYLHGLAGDLGADKLGMHSLIASDIIDFIPYALKEITNYTRFA